MPARRKSKSPAPRRRAAKSTTSTATDPRRARVGSGDDLLKDLRRAFDDIDVDSSGSIDADELRAALVLAGAPHSDADVKDMMSEADSNADGSVDFDEFVTIVRQLDSKWNGLTGGITAFTVLLDASHEVLAPMHRQLSATVPSVPVKDRNGWGQPSLAFRAAGRVLNFLILGTLSMFVHAVLLAGCATTFAGPGAMLSSTTHPPVGGAGRGFGAATIAAEVLFPAEVKAFSAWQLSSFPGHLSNAKKERNCYNVLGCPNTATPQELVKRKRESSKQYHPDKNPNNATAAEIMVDINLCSALQDAGFRTLYDLYGELSFETGIQSWRKHAFWHHVEEFFSPTSTALTVNLQLYVRVLQLLVLMIAWRKGYSHFGHYLLGFPAMDSEGNMGPHVAARRAVTHALLSLITTCPVVAHFPGLAFAPALLFVQWGGRSLTCMISRTIVVMRTTQRDD